MINPVTQILMVKRAEQEEPKNELHKDKEPTGLLGIALRVIRKIFH